VLPEIRIPTTTASKDRRLIDLDRNGKVSFRADLSLLIRCREQRWSDEESDFLCRSVPGNDLDDAVKSFRDNVD